MMPRGGSKLCWSTYTIYHTHRSSLFQIFETSGIQLMADTQCDAQGRIQALLEYLHEREMDLETIAESKRQRLEQCVQLRNFELEARQVVLQITLYNCEILTLGKYYTKG